MGLNFSKIDWDESPSTREKVYFIVVLLLIVFAVARLFWFPSLDSLKKKEQDLKNIQLQISTLEKFIEIDKKIVPPKKSQQKTFNKHLESTLQKMSGNSKEVIAEVTGKITSRKLMGNVILNALAFKAAAAHTGYTTVPVSLSVAGTFSSIQKYVTMMERLDYLFTVDNVKFTRSEGHAGLLVADLDASIYIAGVLPEAKKVDEKTPEE